MPAVVTTQLQTGHIGLNVTNLKQSKQFYQDVFGFTVIQESEDDEHRFAFLGDGSRLVLTLWQQSQGHFEKSQPGLHHLSFQVDSIDQVKHFEKRLGELGVSLFHQGIVAHREGAASGGLFFADPDGIRLEIYSPTGAGDYSAPAAGVPTCGFF